MKRYDSIFPPAACKIRPVLLSALLLSGLTFSASAREVITAGFDEDAERFNTEMDGSYSDPREPFAVPGGIYFHRDDAIHGYEWWFSDGTVAGTAMVCDQRSHSTIWGTAAATSAVSHGNMLISATGNAGGGYPKQYFKITGKTAAAVELLPLPGLQEGVGLHTIIGANAGGTFIYAYGYQQEAVFYQPFAGGPARFIADYDSEDGVAWVSSTGRFFVTGYRSAESGLWTTTDGTPGSIVKLPIPWDDEVMRATPSWESGGLTYIPTQRQVFNPTLGGYQTTTKLWRTDGTVAGTFVVLTAEPGEPLFLDGLPDGNRFWLLQKHLFAGPAKLYKTDGTVAGTQFVKELPAAWQGWNFLGAAGGKALFFTRSSPGDLWRSDGTAAGTAMFAPLPSPPEQFSPPYQGWVYFKMMADNKPEMWRTNGTTVETFRTFTFPRPTADQFPFEMRVANGLLFFIATSSNGLRYEIWRTDGTAAGTFPVTTTPSSFIPRSLPVLNPLQTGPEAFHFSTFTQPSYKIRNWRSDGRPVGQGGTAVWNVTAPQGDPPLWLIPGHYQSSDGHVALQRPHYEPDGPLWVWRESTGVTQLPGTWTQGEFPDRGGFYHFTSTPPAAPPYTGELDWRPGSHEPDGILTVRHHVHGSQWHAGYNGGKDFFWRFVQEVNIGFGYELISSDGTAAGSAVVGAFGPDQGDFISISDGVWALVRRQRLYTFSGSAQGGQPATLQTNVDWVDRSVAVNGALYFTAANTANGIELWRWQPGAPPALVKDIVPGPGSSGPAHLRAAGGRLWFSADDGVHGYEPWISDGTAAGTHLLADLRPGSRGSDPAEFTETGGGYVIFAADDGVTGRELWQSSGTAASTRVHDSYPGAESLFPHQLVRWNESVIHMAKPTDSWMSTAPVDLVIGVFTPDPTPGWAAWLAEFAQNTTPGAAAPHGDPDKDGADNFSEYAFGSFPLNAASLPALMSVSGPAGCLTFRVTARRDAGVAFAVEGSADLLAWTSGRFQYTGAGAGGTWEMLTPGMNLISEEMAGDGVSALTICVPAPAGAGRYFTRVTAAAR